MSPPPMPKCAIIYYRSFPKKALVNAFTTGNPVLGNKLLGVSIGTGLGALKGLS